jgi:hypothetical protein
VLSPCWECFHDPSPTVQTGMAILGSKLKNADLFVTTQDFLAAAEALWPRAIRRPPPECAATRRSQTEKAGRLLGGPVAQNFASPRYCRSIGDTVRLLNPRQALKLNGRLQTVVQRHRGDRVVETRGENEPGSTDI